MVQNHNSFPEPSGSDNSGPFDFQQERRGLDEPPLGFGDGSTITKDDLGFLARVYLGARDLFGMDWDGLPQIQSPVHRKPRRDI